MRPIRMMVSRVPAVEGDFASGLFAAPGIGAVPGMASEQPEDWLLHFRVPCLCTVRKTSQRWHQVAARPDLTDSTIAPPKANDFSFTNVLWLLDTRKDTIENKVSICFLVCKGLSIDDVGVSRDTILKEIRPGAGFETGDFVKEKFGGLP